MSKARFLYNNLISVESMITVSSLKSGIVVTSAKKTGTGSATLAPSGSFSGAADTEYTVEIDSIAAGAEVGQATFRWRDGSVTGWNATNVTTSAVNILLNNDVYIKHTAGTGADFVLGDKWQFKGINLFNPAKMIDFDRDHVYRSAALEAPNTITINFGAGREVKALILFDHNLTSAAVITLEADAAATFDSGAGGAPQFTESITWAADKILHYLTTATTKQYWRVKITDAANPYAYIEIAELYLGSYMELSNNYVYGEPTDTIFLETINSTPYGIERKRYHNTLESFTLDFAGAPDTDITAIKAMLATLSNRATGQRKPLYFNHNPAISSDVLLVDVTSFPRQNTFIDRNGFSLDMKEVARSV
jgi:hypothetical protein